MLKRTRFSNCWFALANKLNSLDCRASLVYPRETTMMWRLPIGLCRLQCAAVTTVTDLLTAWCYPCMISAVFLGDDQFPPFHVVWSAAVCWCGGYLFTANKFTGFCLQQLSRLYLQAFGTQTWRTLPILIVGSEAKFQESSQHSSTWRDRGWQVDLGQQFRQLSPLQFTRGRSSKPTRWRPGFNFIQWVR